MEMHPYLCWGFKIDHSVVYLSDVSFIPDDLVLKSVSGTLPVFVFDCLALDGDFSHLDWWRHSILQRKYLTGFSHRLSHDECHSRRSYSTGIDGITTDIPRSTTNQEVLYAWPDHEEKPETFYVFPLYTFTPIHPKIRGSPWKSAVLRAMLNERGTGSINISEKLRLTHRTHHVSSNSKDWYLLCSRHRVWCHGNCRIL